MGFLSCVAATLHGETTENILQAIRDHSRSLENVSVTSEWRSHIEGQQSTWETQRFAWDDLGRRYLRQETGPLSENGDFLRSADPVVTVIIFDGEVVADSKYYSELNRVGSPPKKGEKKGYYAVIVASADSPVRRSLNSMRNPLEYINNAAIPLLEEAVASDSASVRPIQDDKFLISIKAPAHEDADFNRCEITVITSPHYAISKVAKFGVNDHLNSELVYTYTTQDGQVLVPKEGQHVHWGDRSDKQKPYFDWSFNVSEVRYNTPSFDESIFDIRIPPDAAVSDTRYKVAYRVGEEEIVGAILSDYAKDAKQKAGVALENLKKGNLESNSNQSGSSFLRKFLIWLNAAVIAIIIIVYYFKKKRRG